MRWYADELLGHGERVLKPAAALLGKDAYGLDISGKVAVCVLACMHVGM